MMINLGQIKIYLIREPPITKKIALSADELCEKITTFLDQKQAENIVVIPLSGKSSLTNFLVIAAGQSSRQVGSMGEGLYRELKNLGIKSQLEGFPQCDWVIIDANDVVVHLFKPEVRLLYNLEKMWGFDLPHDKK